MRKGRSDATLHLRVQRRTVALENRGFLVRNWDELAAPWLKHEAMMEAAHAPVLEVMLASAGISADQRVLDIGIGSGLSTCRAAEAVGQGGHVTAVDVAPPFVARASARVPSNVTVLEADAETHDFGDAGFDCAISIFGTMFFDETSAAFANIRKAMQPGGTFTFASWAPPAMNPWLALSGQVANTVLGEPDDRPDPNGPGPFRFADPAVALDALEQAGWTAGVETVSLMLTPPGTPVEIAENQMEIGVVARRIKDEVPDAENLEELRLTLSERFAQLQTSDGAVLVPARVHIFTARA